jgi:hypothetical protein
MISVPCLLALVAPVLGAPRPGDERPSLDTLPAAEAAPAPAAPELFPAPTVLSRALPRAAQGTEQSRDPYGTSWWLSGGIHYFDGSYDSPLGLSSDEDQGWEVNFGYYSWAGEMGFGLEAGYIASSFDVDVSSLATDTIDTRRYLAGIRFADRMETSSLLTYLRGGYMYREDDGDVVTGTGHGFYVGGGLEWQPLGVISVGPQVLYTNSGSLDATEWIFGANVTIHL